MDRFKLIAAAVILIAPTMGIAQGERVGVKQKAWLPANFRSFDCATVTKPSAALSGGGEVSFDGSGEGGVAVSVETGADGAPTIAAHAVNTKGTGGNNGRSAPLRCGGSAQTVSDGAASCSVSGDADAPTVRFMVQLAALSDPASPSSYVGTVTIVKNPTSDAVIGAWLSRKGYDYYMAQSDRVANVKNPDLMIVASCDSSKIKGKSGSPLIASYDLAVGKK